MNKFLTGLVILAAISLNAGAQEMPDIEDEQTSQDLAEQLVYFQEHPVNLNHAGLDQLMTLPGLTPYQALRLEKYLKTHPDFSDPYLLVRDSVLDPSSLEGLLPYICIDPHLPKAGQEFMIASRLQRRWPDAEGIADGGFGGSPLESRTRMRFRAAECWELFGQIQHDVGEPSWRDYFSGSVSWTDDDKIAILGDYQLDIGEGLLFGGSSPRIFSSYPAGLAGLGGASVRPYHSSQECRGLRGLCIKYPLNDMFNIACFVSRRKMDAKIDTAGQIASIYDEGYHRTAVELDRKNNIAETIIGGRAGISNRRSCQAGITGYRRGFDRASIQGLYNATLVSLDARAGPENSRISFELAGPGRAVGGYNGEYRFLSGKYSGMIRLYGYCPEFKPPRFNSENYYGGDDEKGITLAGCYGAFRGINLSAICNQFYPWRPFTSSSQGYRGHRYEARLDKNISGGLGAEFRLRSLQKESFDSRQSLAPLYQTSNFNIKAGLRWRIGKRYDLNGRYQTAFFRDSRYDGRERGELMALALKAQLISGITIYGQTVFHHIRSYEARLYLTEPELMSGGSFHGYWGLGSRDALLLRCALGDIGAGYLKIARQVRDYQGQIAKNTELGIELEILLK